MVDIPENDDDSEEPREITDGVFEQEYYLTREQAGDFLVELGEQLKADTTVTLSSEEWVLPFEFEEPVELEIEFIGHGERELELELELRGASEGDAPQVS